MRYLGLGKAGELWEEFTATGFISRMGVSSIEPLYLASPFFYVDNNRNELAAEEQTRGFINVLDTHRIEE